MSNIYYIYAYLRKDGTPYYIGKGKDNRAWKKGKGEINPPKDKNKIIIMENNLSEIGSLSLERFYIRWYGRIDLATGILRNKTDGGEGASGHKGNRNPRPKNICEKISKSKTGTKLTNNHKNSVSNGLKRYYENTPSKRNKKIKTPDGIFNSQKDAGLFYQTNCIGYWMKKYPTQYYYLS